MPEVQVVYILSILYTNHSAVVVQRRLKQLTRIQLFECIFKFFPYNVEMSYNFQNKSLLLYRKYIFEKVDIIFE